MFRELIVNLSAKMNGFPILMAYTYFSMYLFIYFLLNVFGANKQRVVTYAQSGRPKTCAH